ncbi:MAG: DNA-binding response regulator [Alteromonadaceae bacterium]|nr:MAG: DNA-binding response regulator [Alteromonadaceae bacterium]
MNQKILLVDDDLELCQLLAEFLLSEGFECSMVHSGSDAIQQLQPGHAYEAIVLDIMMPGMSGLEVLQQLRQSINTPIIMLTGRGDDIDRIVGLEMGADDYMGKPCHPRELSARLKAVLRRSSPALHKTAERSISLHNISLLAAKREVQACGLVLPLTSAEYDTLSLLMHSAGQVITKAHLTEQVLHRKLGAYDRSIDVHISRLRHKLAQAGASPEVIKTIRGRGYQFLDQDS